jgi:hypothetical protein
VQSQPTNAHAKDHVTKTPLACDIYDYTVPLPPSKSEPYYFDPDDAKLVSLGHAAQLSLNREIPNDTPADVLLARLNYEELTGYKDYDGYYHGYGDSYDAYSAPESPTPLQSVLDTSDTPFDTRAFAAKAWHRVIHGQLNPRQVQPFLGWAPLHVVKKTLEVTTQIAKMIIRLPLRRHIRSRLPWMRATRLNEIVSTDPMFANCRCFSYGCTGGQVFYGYTLMNIHGFKKKGEFPKLYRDYIRTSGVPSGLRRDNAKEE